MFPQQRIAILVYHLKMLGFLKINHKKYIKTLFN